MRRSVKRVGVGILCLGLAAIVLLAVATFCTKLPGEQMTPAGIRRASSLYVKMHDGVEIAVSVYLPQELKASEKVPVLMRTTRYWREPRIGSTARLLVASHLIEPSDLTDKQVLYFNQRRFAVVLVDARGSGASGGRRVMEFSPVEVADIGEVAAWAAQQPWSNGRIGTFGISYEGNTAELAAVPNQPAIRALMPLYDEFDNWDNIAIGGVPFRSLLHEWGEVVASLDRDDVCGADEATGWDCWKDRLMTPGVRPVDADGHGKHLEEMLKQHQNLNVSEAIGKLEFRDDKVITEEGAVSLEEISPSGLRAKIEASKVPMMVWCGWLDGDATGTLIRYRTFSNPQVVVIGPLSHGGNFNVDPFAAKHLPPVPSLEEQYKMEANFFDETLRNADPEPIESSIQYYTMGEGKWKTTKTWPPEGLQMARLYFDQLNMLSAAPPSVSSGSDSYTVDFTASSGNRTRWHTGFGGGDVIYPDRAEEDKKLLVYTGAPLESDLEITGTPALTLEMSSTAADGAVHAYLEDVSPEGRVNYVDEGVFRLMDRKEVDPKSLPYLPLGPAHSFLRKDAEPLTPGETVRIRFELYPTSLLLRKEHRVRVSLAGADAGVFQRFPTEGTPTWTIYRERRRASFLDLPARQRREAPQ
jgi:putative CocE/NonD family hydrolase